jgi:hypothetical protein
MEPVKYQLTKREFVTVMTLRFWCQIKLLILIMIVLVIASWSVDSSPYADTICMAMVFICLLILPLFGCNKIAKTSPDLSVSEKTLLADNDGIKATTATTSSSVNWSVFKKWIENSNYIFLHYNNLRFAIIPKRAFTNEQLTEFKTLLSEKIGPLSGRIPTSDERYAKRAVILAVTSFFLANSFLIITLLSILFVLIDKIDIFDSYRFIFGILMLLCLLASLPISLIAYKMGKRMKGSFTQINITRIFSLLAILSSLFWIAMLTSAPILRRYGPGW